MVTDERTTEMGSWVRYVHPFNIALIWGFKKVSKNHSLRDSLTWLLDQIDVEVRIRSGRYLSEGPQLILGSHHSPIDGIATLSTIEREDNYFIGAPGYEVLGEIVRAKHLPVYIQGRWDRNPLELLRRQVFSRFTKRPILDEAMKKNWQSIKRG